MRTRYQLDAKWLYLMKFVRGNKSMWSCTMGPIMVIHTHTSYILLIGRTLLLLLLSAHHICLNVSVICHSHTLYIARFTLFLEALLLYDIGLCSMKWPLVNHTSASLENVIFLHKIIPR